MFKKLRLALAALACFPAVCFAQEKIVLKLTYPAGKFLYKQEREDVTYESFYRPLFDFRSNTPRKSKAEIEVILHIAPPNEEGFVRTDTEVTKYISSAEFPEEELDPEESRRKLLMKNEEENYNRVVRETPIWSLVDPKAQRVLEVHGCDQLWEKLYEMAEESSWKEHYRQIKLLSGDDAIKKTKELEFRFYPKNPISPGDQWRHSYFELLPILGRAELEFISTLKEIKTNQAGKQIAVVERRSEWKTDDPQILDPGGTKYLQIETSIDIVSEWDVETGMEIFCEKHVKVVAKQRIHYDDGPYLVAFVARQTEKTTGEQMKE